MTKLFPILILLTLQSCTSGSPNPAKPLPLKTLESTGIRNGSFQERRIEKEDSLWVVDAQGTTLFVRDSLIFNDPNRFTFGGKSDSVVIHFQKGFSGLEVELRSNNSLISAFRGTTTNDAGLSQSITIKRPEKDENLSIKIRGFESVNTHLNPNYDYLGVNLLEDTLLLAFQNEGFVYF